MFFFSHYSFCKSDTFRAFSKVRITVLGKLLMYRNVVQGFSHESNHHPVITLCSTIAFMFMKKLSLTRPWQVTMRPRSAIWWFYTNFNKYENIWGQREWRGKEINFYGRHELSCQVAQIKYKSRSTKSFHRSPLYRPSNQSNYAIVSRPACKLQDICFHL